MAKICQKWTIFIKKTVKFDKNQQKINGFDQKNWPDKLTEAVEQLSDTNRKLDDLTLHEAYLIQTNQKLQEIINLS